MGVLFRLVTPAHFTDDEIDQLSSFARLSRDPSLSLPTKAPVAASAPPERVAAEDGTEAAERTVVAGDTHEETGSQAMNHAPSPITLVPPIQAVQARCAAGIHSYAQFMIETEPAVCVCVCVCV
jgi:hypothetical protein